MALLAFVSAGSFVLLAGAKQLSQKPSFRSEAIYYGGETLETLKDYVTTQTALVKYQLIGDTVVSWALTPAPVATPHTHQLPAGVFSGSLAGTRTYSVTDVDLNPAFDSDGDGNNFNDADYKKVTVTVQWQEVP